MLKKAPIKPRTKAKPSTRAKLGAGLSRTELRSSSGLGAGLVQHRSKASGAGYKEITCAFCKGTGKDPFGIPSKLSKCQTCWGKGRVAVADIPHEMCSACKGTGVFEHHRLPCSVCKGKGVVPKDRRKGLKGMNPDTGLPEIGNY